MYFVEKQEKVVEDEAEKEVESVYEENSFNFLYRILLWIKNPADMFRSSVSRT